MNLVIVESPAKAKTINKYLGNDFKVIASFGHIRELPSKNGSVLPEKDFEMKYQISSKAKKYVDDIIKYASNSDNIYLATDPDREGEAISWHIMEVLKKKKIVQDNNQFKRVAFNEITKKAVWHAIENPRDIDDKLVDAQQARLALDYLVGFTLSPVLWRKLPGCRSAGRVQSVALKLICEREAEIEKFVSKEYWSINGEFLSNENKKFEAKLTHIASKKLEKFDIANKDMANDLVTKIKQESFVITDIKRQSKSKKPLAPFITSSLQQDAARKFGFSAKKTMQIAQKLYEGIEINGENQGLITYMRTDGTNLSDDAVTSIREYINKQYGDKYLPAKSRIYKTKSKNAQEAHEAIRPTNFSFLPESIKENLTSDQFKLYELVWKRTIACQMSGAKMDLTSVIINSQNDSFTFRASGSIVTFNGFYAIYKEAKDTENQENLLPSLSLNEKLITGDIKSNQHFTEPPARYSEAGLVKKLEELGIGRPSTYASIISVLQERNYVVSEKKRFIPNENGIILSSFLQGFFSKYVEYDFTANLENELDIITSGKLTKNKLLNDFWEDFIKNINLVQDKKIGDIIEYIEKELEFHLFAQNKNSDDVFIDNKCKSCEDGVLKLKLGKYGAFISCSNYPTCNVTRKINQNAEQSVANSDNVDNQENKDENLTKEQIIEKEYNNKELGTDADNNVILLKKGPYGWYVEVSQTEKLKGKGAKPKRASLGRLLSPENITIDEALKLLSMPFLLNANETDDKEHMLVGVGKFGPYIKYKNKFYSISKDIHPFEITINQAEEIIESKDNKAAKK